MWFISFTFDVLVNQRGIFIEGKTACQDQEEVEGIDTEAEQDELLIECAGTVFSSLGRVLSAEDFALYFQTMLPFFIKRLVHADFCKLAFL